MTLAGALIHQAGGRGAEVADFLHRALSAEAPDGVSRTAAAAFRELGYLSVQRGVPDRAAGWLDRAMQAAQGIPDEQARILAIQGMLASDTAHYGDAVAAFAESRRLARTVRNRRQQAFSEALLGRVHLLRGDLELAAAALDRALDGVAAEHWTAFEPFVAGVRGETYLAAGRLDAAADLIDRSWVMAELAGDHCYMALAAGAEARLFLAHGDLAAAEHWIDRGLEPKPWYLWYTARLLDVAAEVTIATGSPRASQFVERLAALASRSGMREFVVRAQSHRAALGDEAAAQAVPWLAKEIDNPALTAFLARRHGVSHLSLPRVSESAAERVRSRFRKPCPAVVRGTNMQLCRWDYHRAPYCVEGTLSCKASRGSRRSCPGNWRSGRRWWRRSTARAGRSMDRSISSAGVAREVASLMHTPQGDFVCLFHESEDLAKAFQTIATSQDPFDVWFREHLASVHGLTAEMLQGPLPAEVFFEYRDLTRPN